MALTGVSSIAEIGPNVLLDPPFQQVSTVKKKAAAKATAKPRKRK
jgi:hypothetical protein